MEKITIKVHKKEKLYYNLMIAFSIILCIPGILFLPYLLLIGLIILISTGLFVGYLKGNGVRVGEHQFPELHEIVQRQSKLLGIKKMPEVYIVESGGILNAMATKFIGSNYLVLFSDLCEVMMDGRKDIVEFVIAHELCHVKRNHVYKKMYVFPSLIIPFLALAYSRACEYTCDSVGYAISPKGAIDGIKLLASGRRLYTEMNTKAYADQLKEDHGFWTWFSEKLSTHPHLSKRITPEMLRSNFNAYRFSENGRGKSNRTNAIKEKIEEKEIIVEAKQKNIENRNDQNEKQRTKHK